MAGRALVGHWRHRPCGLAPGRQAALGQRSLVINQEAECLQDLVLWVPVQDLVGDLLEELPKASGAAATSSRSEISFKFLNEILPVS